MNIFGVGPMEFILIVAIMLIVLGPREMVNTAYKAGRLIRKIIQSPAWKSMMDTSREIREMPTRLVRESGFEDEFEELRHQTRSVIQPAAHPYNIPKIDPPHRSENPPAPPPKDAKPVVEDDPSI